MDSIESQNLSRNPDAGNIKLDVSIDGVNNLSSSITNPNDNDNMLGRGTSSIPNFQDSD